MPHQDKKRECWAGTVKKIVTGEKYAHLADQPLWKPHGKNGWLYRKVKTGFKLRRQAATWEKEHWQKILFTQVHPDTAILLTFSKVSTQYLKQVKVRAKGRETFRYKQKLIQDVIEFWRHDPPVSEIETIYIENFLDALYKEQGGKKANRSLRELNTLFNWMVNRKFIDGNPNTPIEQYEEQEFKKYVPPADDVLKVIKAANAFEKDLIRTAYHSLARSVELRRLEISHCDFANNKAWFYTRKRKNGSLEGSSVDMNNSLREILFRRCKLSESKYVFPGADGNQLKKTVLDKIMPRIFKRLNTYMVDDRRIEKPEDEQVKPFGFHAIRHHVAAHLFLNCGYSVAEMQKILRHKRASTTDTYLKSIVDMDSARGLNALDDFEDAKEKPVTPKLKRFPDEI